MLNLLAKFRTGMVDGVKVRVVRNTIAQVLNKTEPAAS